MSVSCPVCVQFVSGCVFGLVSGFVSGSRPGSCPGSCLISYELRSDSYLLRIWIISDLYLFYNSF